ncbi:MAG: hypothetical protein IT281_05980 [Ignavibacteria bacterium]|nr:hypothetical protein [Ignavibacteria bacterium]MCC7159065.1 hypothetical protein [Ignavibacteria bacterium]
MLISSQIFLIVFSFLVVMAAIFIYFYYVRSELNLSRFETLLKYLSGVIFVLLVAVVTTLFIYYLKFIYYYRLSAVALIFVILVPVFIPVAALLNIKKYLSLERINKAINV